MAKAPKKVLYKSVENDHADISLKIPTMFDYNHNGLNLEKIGTPVICWE